MIMMPYCWTLVIAGAHRLGRLLAPRRVADLLARHPVRARRLLAAMGLAAEEAGFFGLYGELADLSARDGVPLLAS